MIPETIVLGQVLAPVISSVAVLVLYHYVGRSYLGAEENTYWNQLRIALLSSGDSTVRKKTDFALTNPAREKEKIGQVRSSSEEFAQRLENKNFAQCVLSGLKYRPANINPNTSSNVSYESGSMALRESKSDIVPDVLAKRQIHVFWFDNGDGTLDVYAHEEYSSLNPLFAWQHYQAKTQTTEHNDKIAKKIDVDFNA